MIKRTYGKIAKKNNEWILEEIEPHVSIRLKKIFPKIPVYSIPPYIFKSTPEIDKELEWFMERYPLEISKNDLKKLKNGSKEFEKNLEEFEKILLPTFIPEDNSKNYFKEEKHPRHYQTQMAEIVSLKKVSICGDVMGLGKTITGITTFVKNIKNGLGVVVVPPHLVKQWEQKISEFTNLTSHIIKKSKPYDLPKADIYIFKYGLLKGWVDIFSQNVFHTSIFDEIQELRNGLETQKGEGAAILCKHTKVKLGMSGTPIYNYGGEIWKIYNILEENILGSEGEFQREWCSSLGNGKSKINDPVALGRYLREQHLLIRRTKKDVGLELGKINRIVENIDYDSSSLKDFEELARKLAITARTGSFIQRGQAARELDIRARQITGIAKAKSVAEVVRMLILSGESVLLSGWHREVYNIWDKELKEFNPVYYTGTESISQKEKSKEAFIKGESKLMIISNRSGAGLDGIQYCCSTLVIGELDWSPKVHDQLEKRLDRQGQQQPIMMLFLVSNEGSDPVIMDMCGVKNSQSNGILDLDSENLDYGEDESRIQKLIDHYIKLKK